MHVVNVVVVIVFDLSSSIRHRHGLRAAAVACALVLGAAPTPATGAEEVTESQIQQARSAEQATTASIGELEAALAHLNADTEDAERQAEVANQEYLRSHDNLTTAQTTAAAAAQAADQADKATNEARRALADVVVTAYQGDADPLQGLTPYFGASTFTEVAAAKAHLDRIGENTDAELQKVEALQTVADTMRSVADRKQAAQQAAATLAETAKSQAGTAAQTARTAVQMAHGRREQLIAQLATQRNTTVELETQRQNQLEAARQQAQEETARRDLEARTTPSAAVPAAQSTQQQAAPETTNSQSIEASVPTASAQEEPSQPTAPQPAPTPEPAPPSGSGLGERAVQVAKSYLGVPYVWAGESREGVDCSGLTMLVWRELGIDMPHIGARQYQMGTRVPVSQVQPGDMLFYSYGGGPGTVHHVAMYVGDGQMIEAPMEGYTVWIVPMRYRYLLPYAVRF